MTSSTPLTMSGRQMLQNIIRLELYKQFPAFRLAGILSSFLIVGSFLFAGNSGMIPALSNGLALCSFLFAMICGISAGQKLRDYSEAEAALPISIE
ncbi:MAG: hypothetical protein ACRD4B_00765, partial [Acidobacteriota bacterium]